MFNRLSAFTDACTKRPDAIAAAILFAVCLSLGGCQSPPASTPVQTVSHVDLQRFMGDWYVIANIPTFIEREAYNATERYELNEDGTIQTTFSFNRAASTARKSNTRRKRLLSTKKATPCGKCSSCGPFAPTTGSLRRRRLRRDHCRAQQAGLRVDYGSQPATPSR